MTPLQAAAEREEIRKVAQIAKEKCRRGGLPECWEEIVEQLADALLADHAAREWDSTEITEEWLRSVGFKGTKNPMRFHHPDKDLGELRAIAATKFYDGIEIWQEGVGCLILFSNNQLTRGEMVRLFSGLGIQLSGGGE